MFETRKTRELSTDRVPLREFAADHGRISRSPSPPEQDSAPPDTNDAAKPTSDDPLEASDSLLGHTGVFFLSSFKTWYIGAAPQ